MLVLEARPRPTPLRQHSYSSLIKNGVVAKLVNAAVCKTAIHRFDPGLRLQKINDELLLPFSLLVQPLSLQPQFFS